MRVDEVPQEHIAMYRGGVKAIYAVNEGGEISIAQSTGWSVEELATMQAVEEFERLEAEALEAYLAGKGSPVEVWMYRKRMSLATIAQCTGWWQWQVKRHFNPSVFARLSEQKIQRYLDALDITKEQLYNPKESE